MRGNVVDLAVGVIIGAAFGAIVASLVGEPIIGAVTGGLDFSNYFIPLSKNVTATAYLDAKKQGAALGYGQFLTGDKFHDHRIRAVRYDQDDQQIQKTGGGQTSHSRTSRRREAPRRDPQPAGPAARLAAAGNFLKVFRHEPAA
jgi:large-conductance mechanosensitive channel MscL